MACRLRILMVDLLILPFKNIKFRVPRGRLSRFQLINDSQIFGILSLKRCVVRPKLSSVADMPCLKTTDVLHG